MTTICVLSDTHRNMSDLRKLEGIFSECDMIIHLGDCYDDMNIYYQEYKDKLYRVHGNCDYGGVKEIIIPVEDCLIFATHGDLYGVKQGRARLEARARELGANIALYGHTHQKEIVEREGLTIVNPGCVQSYSPEKSIAYLVINGKKCVATLNEYILKK